eukprot:2165259-Rhodomonas_salina.3
MEGREGGRGEMSEGKGRSADAERRMGRDEGKDGGEGSVESSAGAAPQRGRAHERRKKGMGGVTSGRPPVRKSRPETPDSLLQSAANAGSVSLGSA